MNNLSRRQPSETVKEVAMSGSRLVNIMSIGAALAVLGIVGPTASAATVPNPCQLVSVATVASTIGLKGVPLAGKLSTRPDGRVTQSLCTFSHGGTTIEILIAPHQTSGGSGGGAPGMQTAKPSGLGSAASDYYDARLQYAFANVEFTKGAFDAGAYDHGTISNDRMVALARLLYNALP